MEEEEEEENMEEQDEDVDEFKEMMEDESGNWVKV